ncbi:MAG: 23S rRNA (adenine(2503)-C(2))-methyltransferase RlmN [Clostridiales Family XIII bacterium]|nr:23S rRNA (adenine(2503)-C(2))-methyltransferase RlmN [Clostridiales Family XIII bacterium]
MNNKSETRFKDMSFEALTAFFVSVGEKPFRAKQVFKWLMNGAATWDEMTDLSKDLRAKLADVGRGGDALCAADMARGIDTLRVSDIAVSALDGTRKYLFETSDGLFIETVLMEYYYGWSICISSQAGCRMGCRFCASGKHGLERSLTPGEIADQYIIVERDVRRGSDAYGRALGESGRVREVKHTGDDGKSRIGHIVVMGVGEPFDNYDNVMTFLKNITNPHGRNLGRRQITVSTCGLLPGMRRFMEDLPQANLSLSLHAPNDRIRRTLMPVSAGCGVDELIGFAKSYTRETGRRFTFEYALFAGVNDDIMYAEELAGKLMRAGGGFHVNLIPANPVPELGFAPPGRERVAAFAEALLSHGVRTTTRRELGSDILAACGQLRSARMRG